MSYIIGVHSGHDSSACLLHNNRIIMAIAKERLTRKKHDFGEPIECIEYILKHTNLMPNEIDLVIRCNWFDSKNLNDEYYKKFSKVIINRNHHLFHAYAVSILSKKNAKSLIYVLDGRGCRPIDSGINNLKDEKLFESESLYLIKNNKITPLKKEFAIHHKSLYKWGSHFDSVGYAYAAVSKVIFQDYHAAGKVMALSSFGKKDLSIPQALLYSSKKQLTINPIWLNFLNSFEIPIPWTSSIAQNISYNIQNELENYILYRIHEAKTNFSCNNFLLTGGVALNCKNNGNLINSGILNNLNIFPACGDDGLSIGASIWALREIFHNYAPVRWEYGMGYAYQKNIISHKSLKMTCYLLNSGNIVGIFANGSEYGPRALCNRSILADATNKSMKDILNLKIKHRESFRPFGGVILARNLSKITNEKVASDLMLSAVHVRSDIQAKYPALIHKDGTLRVQVIRKKNSPIYQLLNLYEKLFGKIMLINTSFNGKNEPIVETEEDAIRCAKTNHISFILFSGKLVSVK